MTFPLGQQINTSNLDSADDDPSLARVDLFDLVIAVNRIIASANESEGIVVLDGSSKIPSRYINGFLNLIGDISLRPSTGVVSLRNALRMNQLSAEELGIAIGTTDPMAGDITYLVDGDAGRPCLAVYDGTQWRVVRLATAVGTVGSSITGAFNITAEAD
jgi:hypothetical protein